MCMVNAGWGWKLLLCVGSEKGIQEYVHDVNMQKGIEETLGIAVVAA